MRTISFAPRANSAPPPRRSRRTVATGGPARLPDGAKGAAMVRIRSEWRRSFGRGRGNPAGTTSFVLTERAARSRRALARPSLRPSTSLRATGGWERARSFSSFPHASDFGHCLKSLRVQLRSAAVDQNASIRTITMRAADSLTRLPHGLVGHRAAVDDDPVPSAVARRGSFRSRRNSNGSPSSTRLDAPASVSSRSRPRRHRSHRRACVIGFPGPRRWAASRLAW